MLDWDLLMLAGCCAAGVQFSDFPLSQDSGETGLFSFYFCRKMLFEGMSLIERISPRISNEQHMTPPPQECVIFIVHISIVKGQAQARPAGSLMVITLMSKSLWLTAPCYTLLDARQCNTGCPDPEHCWVVVEGLLGSRSRLVWDELSCTSTGSG